MDSSKQITQNKSQYKKTIQQKNYPKIQFIFISFAGKSHSNKSVSGKEE